MNFLRALYPAVFTVTIVPFCVFVGVWWLGIIVCIALMFMIEHWWRCITGLLNFMALIGGICLCLLGPLSAMRDSARARSRALDARDAKRVEVRAEAKNR